MGGNINRLIELRIEKNKMKVKAVKSIYICEWGFL